MTSTVEMAFGELRASISLFPGHYSAVCWEKFPVLLGQGISRQDLKPAGKFALSNLKNWHEFGKFPVNFPDMGELSSGNRCGEGEFKTRRKGRRGDFKGLPFARCIKNRLSVRRVKSWFLQPVNHPESRCNFSILVPIANPAREIAWALPCGFILSASLYSLCCCSDSASSQPEQRTASQPTGSCSDKLLR